MPGLTISEAARVWGVHRDSVKRWIRTRAVEAGKDNQGIWRIAEGQQPPPSVHGAARGQPQDSPGEDSPGAALVQPQGGPSADISRHVEELTAALAEAGNRMAVAERDRAVSRREVELLRERMAELREELVASKADRERLLTLIETQARALVDLRERPPAAVTEGLVVRMRRWLLGDHGTPRAASQGTGDISGSP